MTSRIHNHCWALAGRSSQKLHHLKLMYGTPDENGQIPLYNFGMTTDSWKKVAAMPKLLQRRADQIGKETGTTPNNCVCVVNFYRSGD